MSFDSSSPLLSRKCSNGFNRFVRQAVVEFTLTFLIC
jgi:hypothetical protein